MNAVIIIFAAIGFISVFILVGALILMAIDEPCPKKDTSGTIELSKTASITTPIKSKNE